MHDDQLIDSTMSEMSLIEGSDILINGWFGPGNAGDEAILSSELALLDKYDVNPIVATVDPTEVKRSHDVSTIPSYNDNPKQWQKTAENMDHIIIGGGGLIESHNIARKWSSVVAVSNELDIPVHFFGVGVTPPITCLHKQMYKYTLEHASTIIVRDHRSRQRVLELNISTPTYVRPDLAFYHSTTTPPSHNREYNSSNKLVVVLREVPWLHVDIDGLIEAIDKHRKRVDCDVTVAEFANKKADQKLVNEFQRKAEFSTTTVKSSNFIELEKLIASSRYVIGMRLHSIVFAAKHGIPFLSIAYNPKCQYVPEQFGYDNVNWCIDIDPDPVAEVISNSWNDSNIYNNLAAAAKKNHEKVSCSLEDLETDSGSMSPSTKTQMYLISKTTLLERAFRRLFRAPRAPAPPSVVPENPQQLYQMHSNKDR